MISILCSRFGLQYLQLIEDCTQDALVEAVEVWSMQDYPDNPGGWLLDVARKKLITQLNRQRLFATKIGPRLKPSEIQYISSPNVSLNSQEIKDAQLKMIFACCHPEIQKEAQLALALKNLCGFGISEIANALILGKETINKQLYRAKKLFREQVIVFEIPHKSVLAERLEMVLKTIYLMFNEGYFSNSGKDIISTRLCFESVRLAQELEQEFPENASVKALLAIMLFQFARIKSRMDDNGDLLPFFQQDRDKWDLALINLGMDYLQQSQQDSLSFYHVQAGICAEYVLASSFDDINWQQILKYYQMIDDNTNEFVQLNHAVACFEAGKHTLSLSILTKLQESRKMQQNWLLYFCMGEIYLKNNDFARAHQYFKQSLNMPTPKQMESKILEKLTFCTHQSL